MSDKCVSWRIWFCCAMCVWIGGVGLAESPSVLRYFGERASRMAQELPALPGDVARWEARRTRVRADLARVLGLPAREPMRAATVATRVDGDVVVEDILFLWAERAYVSANVVRPKDKPGRLPGIVVPPGWLGSLDQSYYRNFVYHMARMGYVLVFIDDPHVRKREAPYAGLYAVASAAGTQVMGIQVFDSLRGLDYLLTRPDVDPGRIGVAGLCQGSEQTWLAAALDERFQYAVPVCGTTTYEGWARMPAFEGVNLSDPSPYVWNVLRYTDWDEVNACIAPRPVLIASNSGDNWWPVPGYEKVVATLTHVFGLYATPERFKHVRDLRSHDMTPYIPEIAPWIDAYVKTLEPWPVPPADCGEPLDPDFSMLRYMQRRIRGQAKALPTGFDSAEQWNSYRTGIAGWLESACDLESLQAGPGLLVESRTEDGVRIESLELPIDGAFTCPALLYGPEESPAVGAAAAVVLSHDQQQCMASPAVVRAARTLARAGAWALVPEHASLNGASRRNVSANGSSSFYGVADTVGLPPLVLRVADNLVAVRYLAGRSGIDKGRIAIAGVGLGGIDACLAAVLDDRIAGVAAVGPTTVRHWAWERGPDLARFTRIMPYLPSISTRTDFDYFFAALAPRPLLLVQQDARGAYPESGFRAVERTASGVYALLAADGALRTFEAKALAASEEPPAKTDLAALLRAAAAALLPQPPEPGQVGAEDGLVSRGSIDTSPGIVWALTEIRGYRQEFAGGDYELTAWTFFNDNGAAQRGRRITPLVFRKTDEGYELTGIGATRTNEGDGKQSFPFSPTAGSATVGPGYYFGWHTGEPGGAKNAGVVEFSDGTDDEATILTLDGETPDQGAVLGKTYRAKLGVPRTYSIQASGTPQSEG